MINELYFFCCLKHPQNMDLRIVSNLAPSESQPPKVLECLHQFTCSPDQSLHLKKINSDDLVLVNWFAREHSLIVRPELPSEIEDGKASFVVWKKKHGAASEQGGCDITLEGQPLQRLQSVMGDMPAASAITRMESKRVVADTEELSRRAPPEVPSVFERIENGTGEVYGDRARTIIFKPATQRSRTSLSRDDVTDDAHRKEVATYQLDHLGFAGVLPTMEATMQLKGTPQAGMIQRFLEHRETADEDAFGRRTINQLATREVHKIGILDVRTLNCDRHGGNLLLDFESGGSPKLVPIDHELCLPHWNQLADVTFCWINWPQANEPFDAETLAYIRDLECDRDIKLLRDLAIQEPSIVAYRLGYALLTRGAALGLRLVDLAKIAVRDPPFDYSDCLGPLADEGAVEAAERQSTLEKLVRVAKERGPALATVDVEDDNFGDAEFSRFEQLLEEYLEAKVVQSGTGNELASTIGRGRIPAF